MLNPGIAMTNDSNIPKDIREIIAQVPDADKATLDSFNAKEADGASEKVVDAIEMIGEEQAAGFPTGSPGVSPGMRYLHSSRTIHQLVTDRNRAVGIYLAVASLLLTASGAIFNAKPEGALIIPIEEIQRWCLPITFGTLTVLALFTAFLLIRTRVGLIYEVAKMNALLGLPIGRVQRNSPLSIHFILQAMVSCAGGASAALFLVFMIRLEWPNAIHIAVVLGVLIGLIVAAALIGLSIYTVNVTTTDERLHSNTNVKNP
jgi:hypothetical protein